MGDNDPTTIALSGQHKFDFGGDATYIVEGSKYFEYFVTKYAYFFSVGFLKISILCSMSLYLVLSQNYMEQNEIIDLLQTLRPFHSSTIQIAKSDQLHDICWNALFGSCLMPIFIATAIYTKCKGEWWEYKELKKTKNKNDLDLKTDVLTL